MLEKKNRKNKNCKKGIIIYFSILLTSAVAFPAIVNGMLLPNEVMKSIYYGLDYIFSFNKEVISDVDDLKEYCSSFVSFDDLRVTLEKNKFINDAYRVYCNSFIDCLENCLPDVNLVLLNEHFENLKINTLSVEEFDDEKAAGRYDSKNNIIEIKEGYDKNALVLFHELVHCARIGNMKKDGKNLEFDYRIYYYGNAFNEAFTELIANYLISNQASEYFEKDYRQYRFYERYVPMAYQILKLVEEEYTVYDFFNEDVSKLSDVLEKYGLEELIILYDADLKSHSIRDKIFNHSAEIKKLELELLSLRVEQELKKGTNIREIYLLKIPFIGHQDADLIRTITNVIKKKENYEYIYLEEAKQEEFILNSLGEVSNLENPNICIFHNDKPVYDGPLYNTSSKILKYNLYIYPFVNNGVVEYRMCKYESDSYVDIVTNKEIKSTSLIYGLGEFLYTKYNCDINLEKFLKSTEVNNDMSFITKKIEQIILLEENGITDFDLYNNAMVCFDNIGIDLCNDIMSKRYEEGNWVYRLNNNENSQKENFNPLYKIYYNNEIIYENNWYKNGNDKLIENRLYVVGIFNDDGIEFKLVKSDYTDILTNEPVKFICNPIPLTEIIGQTCFDVKINLNNFLNSEHVENIFRNYNPDNYYKQKTLGR